MEHSETYLTQSISNNFLRNPLVIKGPAVQTVQCQQTGINMVQRATSDELGHICFQLRTPQFRGILSALELGYPR